MKLRRIESQPTTELALLGEEIHRLREPGRYLKLPDDLKVRICNLHQAGISLGEIRRVTGVQSSSIKAWKRNNIADAVPRPFKIVEVEERGADLPLGEVLTFRFASGKVTVDVSVSALSPELLQILTSC